MGTQLSAKDNALYKSTDEVLHYIWDPIGVAGAAHARDEYYSYLPHVFKMLLENESNEAIANYLAGIEDKSMGLSPNIKKALEVARILKDYKEMIDAQYP